MTTVPIDRNVLTTLLDMAQSHVEDVRSGLAEGLYQQADNQDLPAKEAAIVEARRLLKAFTPLSAKKPLRMVCAYCGGEDVKHDAWAEWDPDTQEWVLGTVFDFAHCETCDGETTINEVEMQNEED